MRARSLLGLLTVLAAVVGLGLYVAVHRPSTGPAPSLSEECEVRTAEGGVHLDFEQMANAATIAAVGLTREVPERAILVALATALQESKLRNLSGGDRDSIGLFQQRPSQGWGRPEQIRDPRYAAKKFYQSLLRVRGWEKMRVTDAAQRVQRSAFPEAYQKWADEAGILTAGLTGRAPGAVACGYPGEPLVRGPDAAQRLDTSLRQDWGDLAPVAAPVAASGQLGLAVAAGDHRAGWQFAHWIVAHSAATGVQRVRFQAQEWTADSGTWRATAVPSAGGRVVAEVYRSA